MTIYELWVPSGLRNHPSRDMEQISSITVHTTGNHNQSATAEAHARFQYSGGGGRQASWHYTVDEAEIWQSFNDWQMCWHTGTVRGNESSIGVEICVNSRSGFAAACERSAELVAQLLMQNNLEIEDVLQHHHWSGKNCPAELRSGSWGLNWEDFIEMVKTYLPGNESESIIGALRQANVQFNTAHWRGVFNGSIQPNKDWVKLLTSRVIEARWRQLKPQQIKRVLQVLLETG